MPNRMNTQGYTSLIDHPSGAAHFGAWCAIVEICSTREPKDLRGCLPEADGTIKGISRVLARISRLPSSVFEELLPRLIEDEEISWIEPLTENLPERRENLPASPETSGRNRREQKGTGEQARADFPRWKDDEAYVRFAADYLATGAALIDADFAEGYELCWRTLDFSQRLERVSALNRHAEEFHQDPRFVPKPRKFLDTEWARPVRPAPRRAKSESLSQRAVALMQRRIANGDSPL